METFFALASGELEPEKAVRARRVQLAAGDTEILERFFGVFNLAPRARVSTAV
jgi:hypothetical protein